MKLLKSNRLKLPVVYFITDKSQIKEIPFGLPFILGKKEHEKNYIRMLEFEILWQSCVKTGFKLNFSRLLEKHSFSTKRFKHCDDFLDEIHISTFNKEENTSDPDMSYDTSGTIHDFIEDTSYYVDIEVLKNLKIFPIWFDDIEQAVRTNITSFLSYNFSAYNKKLEMVCGDVSLVSPKKNLIIIDISSSIPRACSSTTLSLAHFFAETFYADLLITGSRTILYEYERIHELDIETIYKECGMSNEQRDFLKLVTEIERQYDTVICFGDDHHPGHDWAYKDSKITYEDGKKLCKWTVNKIISLHTNDHKSIAGYARWFNCENVQHIENWVKDLK